MKKINRNTLGFIIFVGCTFTISCNGAQSRQENVTFKKHIVDASFGARGADVGDRNKEGIADIIASTGREMYWYREGEKHVIAKFKTATSLIHLRTADIDRDGDIDVIVADHKNGIRYFENPGSGAVKKKPWPQHYVDNKCIGAHSVSLADINGDGRIDVVASGEAKSTPPDSICWYACPENPNDSGAWPKYILGPGQSGGLAHYSAIADVDGDSKLDVVHAAKSAEGGEWFRLWTQPENPRGAWTLKEIGSGYTQATNVQIGDIDGDGKVVILASQGHYAGVLWFKAPNWEPTYIDKELQSPHTLVLADIDNDGDLDAATCAYLSKKLVWFENNGSGEFRRHLISDNQGAYDLVARDIDNDGDLDLLVAGQNSKNVVWYEQLGSPE